MNKLIRWYNQNRLQFYIILSIIIFIFLIIQVLDSLAQRQQQERLQNIENQNSRADTSEYNSKTDTSVITREKVSGQDDSINTGIIKQFVEYCNNKQIQNAYDMLSTECKELIYPTLVDFKTGYYQRIFYINRMYKIENWYKTRNLFTYSIKYTEDILATGKVEIADSKVDYITIVKDNDEYKLNINGYIGREKTYMSTQKNDIYAAINWIDMYMDYCIANISFRNYSKSTICIDTKEVADSLYMYDESGVKYTSFLNEVSDEKLLLKKGEENTISIKFNKIYNPNIEIVGVNFTDVVLNYEKYNTGMVKKEKIKLEVK